MLSSFVFISPKAIDNQRGTLYTIRKLGNRERIQHMNKAFWQGFREGYLKATPYGIVFALGVCVGKYIL